MAILSASGRTARARILRAGTMLLAIAAATSFAPAHAASCDSVANIAADLWDEYGRYALEAGCDAAGAAATAATAGASGAPADAADACLENATKRERLVRQMVVTWNRLAENRWATIGPRQLLLGTVNRGTIVGPGTRLFVTPAPVHAEAVDLAFTKEDFRGAAEVTVCAHAPDGHKARRMNFTVARGDANIGKKWLQRIDGVKGQLLSVHVVGKSVAKNLRYAVDVAAVDAVASAGRAGAGTVASSPGPRSAAPEPAPSRGAGDPDVVATCRAALPAGRELQRSTRGLQARVPAAGVAPIGGAAPLPLLGRVASPPSRPLAAFAPDGGWVLAHGTRSFARGLPAEASRKLGEFTGTGRSIDAVAFTPGGGWTIVAGDASWTRNVGGGYHAALKAVLAEGRRVHTVAFHPVEWNARRGFVLAHDAGFTAANIPAELCGKLREFTRAGSVLDAVAFTPKGGWTAVAGGLSWTRDVGGPRPDYHGGLTDALAAGARVHAVAFDHARQGVPGAWLLLTDRGFRGRGLPGEVELQLVRTLGLRNQAGE